MPADTSSPLQVAEKLLQPEQPLPLMASESMVPFRDHVIAKHFVLVQDTTCMDDGRCAAAVSHKPAHIAATTRPRMQDNSFTRLTC